MFSQNTNNKKHNMYLQICMEKAMTPHSSTFAWKIPWGHKESDTTERLHVHILFLTGSLLLFLHISAETSPS